MNAHERERLISAACLVRERAYAPYSRFRVGAALLTHSGEIITGCNIENASFGLTICAERSAAFTAIAQGQRQFTALAVAASGGGTPCGACRQVLAEFAPHLPVLIVNADAPEQVQEVSLAELLPLSFTPDALSNRTAF